MSKLSKASAYLDDNVWLKFYKGFCILNCISIFVFNIWSFYSILLFIVYWYSFLLFKDSSYTANAYSDSNAFSITSSSRVGKERSIEATRDGKSSSSDSRKPKPHERTRAKRRRLLRQVLAANSVPGEQSAERVPLSKKQRRKLQHIIDSKQAKLQVRTALYKYCYVVNVLIS